MNKNTSNIDNTNIFETSTGVLNVAPIKISGQYKIVVALDGKLYLDDYSGRRVVIDKKRTFLPQVSNFLKNINNITNTKCLAYGGFQKSTKKYWHIPLYIGTANQYSIPKYFVLTRVPNTTLSTISNIYLNGKIHNIIDLEKIGIHEIFNQIVQEHYYNYPVYFNWEENNIRLYGYSIDKDTPIIHTFDFIDNQANQPYFANVNNLILNTFVKQNMFFPCFINLEFEFVYSNEYTIFNNFYGFLSNGMEISYPEMSDIKFNIRLQDYYNGYIKWNQEFYDNKSFELNSYIDIVGDGYIKKISTRLPQFSLKTSQLTVGDKITIKFPNSNDIEFEYIVDISDIASSLFESLTRVCKKATTKSLRNFVFSVKQISTNYCEIKIITNISDIIVEDYVVEYPKYFIISDRFENNSNINNFRGIKSNDIWFLGQHTSINNISNILIDNTLYNIIEKFKYDDKTILRLNNYIESFNSEIGEFYHVEIEKLIQLTPINFLSLNSNLECELPYNQDQYVNNLVEKFSENYSITKFQTTKIEQNYQYVNDNLITKEFEYQKTIEDTNINIDSCLSMIFNSLGANSYITPQTLNIDKRFFLQNGNLDSSKLDSDSLRYNWFLINSECPNYLKNDIRSLRYFNNEELPKLTSRLLKISNDYCETIFLGIKYQLPTKYENFQFAVYVNINDPQKSEMEYNFIVNKTNKTIYLVLNKYLDFIDLLRGGNDQNQPLVDLSFFYSIEDAFNINSIYVGDFKSSILKLCEDFLDTDESIYFRNIEVRDWKYYDSINNKYYIALRTELSSDNTKISDLRKLFNNTSEDVNVYVYAEIEINGLKYTYPSMIVTIEGINSVNEKYLWCEDIQIKFFDTQEFFVQKYNIITENQDYFSVNKDNIISLEPISENIFGDYEKIVTILHDGENKQFNLILPDKSISLKEYYFEINQKIENGILTKTIFKFSEFSLGLSDSEILETFNSGNDDYSVLESKITLFNRNQIWRIIQDLFKIDLKFKFLAKEIIRSIINKFMVNNLIDFSDVNSIPIQNSQELIKLTINDIDKNVVIWNLFNENKIQLINRFRGAYLPYLPIAENEIDFQLPLNKINNTLFNIYDKDFGGLNISATGIWYEVMGNIISSFFCPEEDIIITVPFSTNINYKDLINSSLVINQIIITNINEEYIKKINANIDEYILDSFTEFLLSTYYVLDSVKNELEQKINFTVNSQNEYLLNFNQISTYSQSFTKLIFIFKRK